MIFPVFNWKKYKDNYFISYKLAYDLRLKAELCLEKFEKLNAD